MLISSDSYSWVSSWDVGQVEGYPEFLSGRRMELRFFIVPPTCLRPLYNRSAVLPYSLVKAFDSMERSGVRRVVSVRSRRRCRWVERSCRDCREWRC